MNPSNANDILRDRLRQETSHVIRRHARRRRYRSWAWTGCSYAAGALTVFLLSGPEDLPAEHAAESVPVATAPASMPTPGKTSPGEKFARFGRAVQLELLAATAPESDAPAMLREAGDLYLMQGDMDAAVRCYHVYLEKIKGKPASPSNPGETWLLALLRTDRESNARM
jgi:hypothetical protein